MRSVTSDSSSVRSSERRAVELRSRMLELLRELLALVHRGLSARERALLPLDDSSVSATAPGATRPRRRAGELRLTRASSRPRASSRRQHAHARELLLLACQLGLALRERLLPALDRARRNSTAPSSRRRSASPPRRRRPPFPAPRAGRELAQLGMPLVELGGAAAEHLLDGDPQLVRSLLAPLEIRDGLGELLGAQLDLLALLGECVLDLLVGLVGWNSSRSFRRMPSSGRRSCGQCSHSRLLRSSDITSRYRPADFFE